MATFKENLKQTFANFKTKYIGNVPEGVTVAQINQHLTEMIMYPDVSQDFILIGENIAINYTAPADGFVSFISNTTTIQPRTISINGKQVFQMTSGAIPVKQGQVVTSNDVVRVAHFTYAI